MSSTPEAHLVGKDPYTEVVDPNFMFKGERFRAERTLRSGGKKVIYGTLTMSGHAVSPNFGWLKDERLDEAKRERMKWGSVDSYINVHLDHRESGYYGSFTRPNEGLYGRHGWVFYSLPEVAIRKERLEREAKLRYDLSRVEEGLKEAVLTKDQAERLIQTLYAEKVRIKRLLGG